MHELSNLRRSNQLLAAQVDQLEQELWVLKVEETATVSELRRDLEEVMRCAELMEQEYSALEAEHEAQQRQAARGAPTKQLLRSEESAMGAHLLGTPGRSRANSPDIAASPTATRAAGSGREAQPGSPHAVIANLQHRLANSPSRQQRHLNAKLGGSGLQRSSAK